MGTDNLKRLPRGKDAMIKLAEKSQLRDERFI